MDAVQEPDELERLRRQLRAQAAVNRQLHAQLEDGAGRVAASGRIPSWANGAGGTLKVRRVKEGSAWLRQLHVNGGRDPILVRTPSHAMYVVEGGIRRPIKAGILFVALTRVLGEPRQVSDAELEQWVEGPPVMVMEAGSGPAFVVVGGRRLPLRGLPLPHLVPTEDKLLFPEGEELNVGAPRLSRNAVALQILETEGAVRGGAKLLRRAGRRLVKPRR